MLQNSDQMIRVTLDDGASVDLMTTPIYTKINAQMFYEDGKPRFEQYDKDWTNLVVYVGSIIKQIGVKPFACM